MVSRISQGEELQNAVNFTFTIKLRQGPFFVKELQG